ncbi:hypothetical protein Clacol_003555 [Clathrus columnatus]|uniref:Endoplasmic reticulum transmembrane protein n=1 Tax=Clathrus columnatus TaxID=1419009 RepID=A0AAV5A789_9AGAM|nr:hypothetical protein Clacol_003555 [Clathrus columnatus]
MTVYYTLTFLLLAAEMVTFCIIVSPLPYQIRKPLFNFLSENAFVAKIAYALKISFIFVGVLFIDFGCLINLQDAVQRMLRITAEIESAKADPHNHALHDARTETSLAARRFYAQRNTYLTGFCLFLSLIITRTFYILLDLLHTQTEYAKLQQSVSNKGSGPSSQDKDKEIKDLKAKLAAAERKSSDFDTLKKQASQQAAEYDRLATEYIEMTGTKSDKRKD